MLIGDGATSWFGGSLTASICNSMEEEFILIVELFHFIGLKADEECLLKIQCCLADDGQRSARGAVRLLQYC